MKYSEEIGMDFLPKVEIRKLFLLKGFLLLFVLIFIGTNCIAQDDELEPVDDPTSSLSALLGDTDNTIEKVRLISESENAASIEVSYKGFKNKKYKIKGSVLSKAKKALKEVETIIKDVPGNSSSLELRFVFKQSSTKTYKKPSVDSRYLSLTIYDADDSLGDLDLGGMNVFGKSYSYKLNKKWRISGSSSNANIIVDVKLTPLNSAKTIKQ